MVDLDRALPCRRNAVEQDGAARGLIDIGEQVEDRGLAGTVRSDEAVELALFDIDRKIVDSL